MRFEIHEINNLKDLAKFKIRKLSTKKVVEVKDDSWDYRDADTKLLTHCYHSYPAMMIPQVAGRLIDEYGNEDSIILDPFCGSGTVLVESLIRGNLSIGIDINPLAILIASAKTSPISEKGITLLKNRIYKAFGNGANTVKIPSFFNITFWFKDNIIVELSKLKHAIDITVKNSNLRNFFYVAFSETVRDSSNTRNSEFKLFRMRKDLLADFNPNVWEVFERKTNRNIKGLKGLKQSIMESIYLPKVLQEDTRNKTSLGSESIDLIVTSPPYGDSKTTVAYGQFSRLSMQWLGINDINVDRESLGGKIPREYSPNVLESDSFVEVHRSIHAQDSKRAKDVYSFFADLKKSFKELNRVLKPGGIACFVVGNRTVKGINIPTDRIIAEFGQRLDWKVVNTIIRNIPNKRMPSRNSPSNIPGQTGATMTKEFIVILKKE